MDNADLDVMRQVVRWQADGHAAVLGTVTRTWGSAPRPAGSIVAIRGDGRIAGSVSGGCIEDDLVDRARAGALVSGRPQIVRYGIEADAAHRFGLPCGGLIELVLEPVRATSRLPDLLRRLEAGERIRRRMTLATGEVELQPSGDVDELRLDDVALVTHHGPRWRLLLIGAGQMTRYVARIAASLDYEVVVCDPRDEYADGFDEAGATLTRAMPDDAVTAFAPDGHTAVIALTHDPKLDDLALMEALASHAFYVGAIGSRANQARRRERLEEHFGLSPAQLGRLHGPVGLKNGARTPPEIAISILAELTAVRYGYHVPAPTLVRRLEIRPADCPS